MNQHLLSQSEINHYHDEGFLIPQMTLEGSEIEELNHAVNRVLDANSGIRPCLLYTSPSPRDAYVSRMPSSA